MNVQCPSCRKKYDLNEAHLAKGPIKLQCPGCKHIWTVKKTSFKTEDELTSQIKESKPKDHSVHKALGLMNAKKNS